MASKFEVVISGISGRFPECDDIATFRKKLYELDNFITVDNRKWPVGYCYKPITNEYKVPSGTGKYQNVSLYDFRAFKFNHVVGRTNDIINRKVLEPSYEAIVDAGINPFSLDGSNTGVFMSCGITDTDAHYNIDHKGYLFVLGSSKTMQSNRVSFAFNFTGPSYTYQADILGSLEALRAGYKNVADGYIDAAIVGVSSNVTDPKLSIPFQTFNFLSSDALCSSFDKNATGYGRSESTVVLFLQRAEDAKRNYGTLVFCDTSYYGLNSSTLLDYNENILKNSLQTIYNRNNGSEVASKICFMELTGNGVQKLEKIECNIIADVVCKERKFPLFVGSVKSNVGNTETSAALISVLKALFALDSGVIAANANFYELNEKIRAFAEGKLQVVNKKTELSGNMVAINAVGITGTINHAILKQNPRQLKGHESEKDNFPRLLLICGRTKDGLKEAVSKIESIPYNKEFISLTNDVFGSYMPFHVYRGYTILPKSIKTTNRVQERGEQNRPVWFLFSGMGSQWNGMGKRLLDVPIFANIIEKCNEVLKSKSIDIYKILTSDDPTLFDNNIMAFVGIISIQIGLFEILKALNIKPDGIIGHSVGENGCAYADGCLTLEQAILASYERGMASVEAKTIKGMMAAIGKGYEEIKNFLPEDIEVACHNSVHNCTLTGPADKIHTFVKQLKDSGIFARSVNVANIAYHSKYIAPAAPQLLLHLKKIIPSPKKRSSKWISTSVQEAEWDQPLAQYCSAEYLTNNLLNPVLFEEGCRHIPNNAIVVEIAPHGLLQAILKRSLPETCTNISLTQRTTTGDIANFFLSSIGKLYLAGCEPNINELFPKIQYPVPRGTPSISPYCTWHHEETSAAEAGVFKRTDDAPLSSEIIPIRINEDSKYSFLKDHRLEDQIIIPPSLFMYLTWYILSIRRNEEVGTTSIIFENIKILKIVTIAIQKPRYVSIMIQASGSFEVLLENEKNPEKIVPIMIGNISVPETNAEVNTNIKNIDRKKCTISHREIYSAFKDVGYQMEGCFALLNELIFDETEHFAEIKWNGNWITFLDSLIKFQIFPHQKSRDVHFPYSIRKLLIFPHAFTSLKMGSEILCHKDVTTGRLQCKGLQMEGFVSKIFTSYLPKSHVSNVKIRGLRFVSYQNPGCQNIAEFIKLCIQIAIENMYIMVHSNKAKLNICESNPKYSKIIQILTKKDKTMKSMIIHRDFKDVLAKKNTTHDKCILLLTNTLEKINTFEAKCIFVLIVDEALISGSEMEECFTTITKQTFDQNTFRLLKKKSKTNANFSKVYTEEEYNIAKHYSKCVNDHEPAFIIRKNFNFTDLSIMFSKQARDKKRYLYFMDDINESKVDYESLIKLPVSLDLSIAVLKDGEWGSYRNLAIDSSKLTTVSKKKRHPKNLQLESVHMHFFCFDSISREITNFKDHSYGIEYSGVDESGKRIMGLTCINSADHVNKRDPILLWRIPQEWSLEDAVTVPFIYAQAYYVVMLTTGMGFASSVLINVGKEILFSEVCIAIFLNKKFCVYVTVSNGVQATRIKKRFPGLKDFHILSENKCEYEHQLLRLTNGNGVDIVVNCLSGTHHVTASLNCAGKMSYYAEIGKNNCSDLCSLGLYPFLKSVSFIVIPNKITSILKLPTEEKQLLQKQLEDGINSGLLTPLSKTTVNNEPIKNNLMKVTNEHAPKMGNYDKMNQTLKYGINYSYIIIGDEGTRSSWVELVEWLMNKGVSRFFIALNYFPGKVDISRRLNRILNRKKTSILFTSSQSINTVQGAVNLITRANEVAPLEAIFFVSVNCAGTKILNMDTALKLNNSKVHFISLFSGGLNELESRRRRGLSSMILYSNRLPKNLTNIFSEIDALLEKNVSTDENNSILYEVIDDTVLKESRNRMLGLNDYFPKNLKTLAEIGYDITKTAIFKERTSLSAPYSKTRGVYPIFIIPSVHGMELDSLLRKLYYPVFCATLSESSFSITTVAFELFENLKSIQSDGPVTLIGETWSAAIAIELSSLIKLEKRNVKLFLLEGDPIKWKLQIMNFGIIDPDQIENYLIKQYFDSDSKFNSNSTLLPIHSFKTHLKNYVSKLTPNNSNFKYVIKAANILQKRLLTASKYELKDEILKHVTLFTQSFSENFSHKLSESSEVIVVQEDSYENFIQNTHIVTTINNEANFAWWSNTD